MIDYSKLGVSGNWIIFLAAIIGGLIIAFGSFVGAKKNEFDATAENKKIIDNLKKDLNKETDKLSEEQKRNGLILDKIQSLQDKIDGTTEGIDKITRTTNTVVGIVKNEQRGRGRIAFKENHFDSYKLEMASNTLKFSKQDMVRGFTYKQPGGLITLYIENQEFLLTTDFKDINGDIVFEINKGDWKLRKFRYFVNYDATGLELVDSDGKVYLQIELEENAFQVKGAFYIRDKGIHFVNDLNSTLIEFTDENFTQKLAKNYSSLKRNFKHGDIDMLGERSEGYYKRRNIKEQKAKEEREADELYRNLPPSEVIAETEKFISWFEKAIIRYDKNPVKEYVGIYEEYEADIKKKLFIIRTTLKKDFTPYDKHTNSWLEGYYDAFMPISSKELNVIVKDLKFLLDNYRSNLN